MTTFQTGAVRAKPVGAALFILLLFMLPILCFAGAKPMPAIDARTLSGETVKLPGTTAGKPVVLVFGFARSAKNEGEIWGKSLLEMQRERNNFNFFQVAMLSGAPRITHSFIRSAIRASVPPAYRPHMLLITENGKAWRDLLEVTDDGSAYVVLCNPAGEIQWQTKGAGQAQLDALRGQLHKEVYRQR